MNKKNWKSAAIAFVMMTGVVLLMNCEGDVGPMGNANVIYSDWVPAKLFVDSVSDGSNVNVGHIAAPGVTGEVLEQGVIFVYMNYGAGPMPLPYTSNAGGKASTLAFWNKPGQIIPYRFTHDNTNSIKLSTTLQYRYIILPANMAADTVKASGRMAARQAPDYYELCKRYGIPL